MLRAILVTGVSFVLHAALHAQGGAWVDRAAAPNVGACQGSLLAYDAARGESVWFGSFSCRQTWVWNGAQWIQRAASVQPPAWLVQATYDSARQRVVAVFGNSSNGLQTWEWNGTSWSLRQTGGLPPRASFGLAYDAARQVTVLFGGYAGNDYGFADTWTWNGTSWTQVMFGGPSPRWSVAMTYDVQRQAVLLFGGEGRINGNQAVHGDTWEWNGSQWINHFGLVGPPARRGGRLAYDAVRNRSLLLGGGSLVASLTDQWEWNGVAWAQLQPLGGTPTDPSELVCDAARGVFVTLAGSPSTFEYVPGTTVPATFRAYGSGCAGPAGVPTLAAVPGSSPRIGSILQLQLTNLPTSPFQVPIGFLGFDAAQWGGLSLPLPLDPLGFPGCVALLAPVRSDTLTNVAGVANWNISLPMQAFAIGTDIYFQGAVLVPGWNPGGFVFSNGGHAVVGSP